MSIPRHSTAARVTPAAVVSFYTTPAGRLRLSLERAPEAPSAPATPGAPLAPVYAGTLRDGRGRVLARVRGTLGACRARADAAAVAAAVDLAAGAGVGVGGAGGDARALT